MSIIIPEAVFEEVTIHGKGKPGAAEVEARTWIKRGSIHDRAILNRLSRKLNLGETEAVALAMEMNAAILIDEREGRIEAPPEICKAEHRVRRLFTQHHGFTDEAIFNNIPEFLASFFVETRAPTADARAEQYVARLAKIEKDLVWGRFLGRFEPAPKGVKSHKTTFS